MSTKLITFRCFRNVIERCVERLRRELIRAKLLLDRSSDVFILHPNYYTESIVFYTSIGYIFPR